MIRKQTRHGVLVEGADDERLACRSGKLTHRSRAMARRHRKGLQGSLGRQAHPHPLAVYRCPHCNYWHVGHNNRG